MIAISIPQLNDSGSFLNIFFLQTITYFVQRPAAMKFETVFEFPKVELERKNKEKYFF